MSNELGIFAQGNDAGVKSKDCVDFIHHQDIPNDRNPTYANFVCDLRPLSVQNTFGSRKRKTLLRPQHWVTRSFYVRNQFIFNSVISDSKEGARVMSFHLKDLFYVPP